VPAPAPLGGACTARRNKATREAVSSAAPGSSGRVTVNKLGCLKWGASPSYIIAWDHAIGNLRRRGDPEVWADLVTALPKAKWRWWAT